MPPTWNILPPSNFIISHYFACTKVLFSINLPKDYIGFIEPQIQGTLSETFYIENDIIRSNTWIFNAGNEIYKLVNPQGEEYIMQSYSRKIDNDQTIDDLSSLGSILNLPTDWSFGTEVIQEELRLNSNGEAIVIQDQLRNSYQKK